MTAPKKIWANPYYGPQPNQTSGIWKLENPNGIGTEYTRSDMIPNAAYVAGLEAALRNIRDLNTAEPDGEGLRWVHSDLIDQEIVAALSARPDAPDARTVTVAQLDKWEGTWHCTQGDRTEAEWACIQEIRAIIGEPRK